MSKSRTRKKPRPVVERKRVAPKFAKHANTYVLQPHGLRVDAWTKSEAISMFKKLLAVRELGSWRAIRKAAV